MRIMNEEKIVLGVDLDEVVFKYNEGLREYLYEDLGIIVPDEEPSHYDFVKAGWFDTFDDFRKYHGYAVDTGLYARLDVYEDSVETLRDLVKNGYVINIITSRFVNPGQHRKVVQDTVEALDANRIPYNNISFMDNKALQRADAFIDDAPHNIENLSKINQFVIRQVRPHNVDCGGVPAKNWREIREILRDKFGR